MDEPIEIQNWKRISILGSGAFGVVTLWKNTETNEFIAIKKCKFQRNVSLTEKQKQRWISEVDMMKNLRHENIVGYKPIPTSLEIALNENNPTKLPLLTMEYCKMGNLRHQLNLVKNSSGLSEIEVRTILEDITKGLHHLHRFNITHRDLKPENIVLQQCDSRPVGVMYKIIDLGYAKELKDTVVSFVGTLHYLAPEIMKTATYNYGVDYWSLGITAFEIICGVLPFLPQLDPFQRYKFIEKKEKDHICIYYLHSGRINYSSELLKENHISSCLQRDLSNWLRHVLQFDPNLRISKFPDNTNVFDNLHNILKKTIINVFSVYTLEFYSYEINDSTLLGTLKDWIARDTKVLKNDQYLITKKSLRCFDDNEIVKNLLTENDHNLYVFKKQSFINNIKATSPKCIQVLFEKFEDEFDWKELRSLYCKCLFYINQDVKLISYLTNALNLLFEFSKQSIMKLKHVLKDLHQISSKLIIKTECYYNIKSKIVTVDLDKENSLKYQTCLEKFKNLMKMLETTTVNVNELVKKVGVLEKRQGILNKLFPKIIEIARGCDINKRVQEAILLIEKGPVDKTSITPKDMVQILNRVLKVKDQCLRNKDLNNFFSATSTAITDTESMITWTSNFKKELIKLSKDIDDNEIMQYNILISSKPAKSKEVTVIKTSHGIHITTNADILIKENQMLRYKTEEILSEILLCHKKFNQEMEEILKEKF